MTRRCNACGVEFEADGQWMKLCWSCWRERKDHQAEDAAYERGRRDGYKDGWDDCQLYREDNGPTNGSGPQLERGLLRDLVQLCHPDRHPPERGELANRTTAALLGLLDGSRAGLR